MNEDKRGDLILSQNTFAFIQDGTSGNVDVISGPAKITIGETDKTVKYDFKGGKFFECSRSDAATPWIKATEGQYIELINPAASGAHPSTRQKQSTELLTGKKINISGPDTFALFPGQIARVIDGHQLKSNEYLLVRVYNEKEAVENIAKTVVVGTDDKDKKTIFDKSSLVVGKLIIIKGTDVSFFIPPTGMEVIPIDSDNTYVRDAVTLEMLEYCILLSENGKKRFVKGPDVVFPEPTETFIEKDDSKKFRAVELNDNMGIYVKVIADYKEDDGTEHKAGEELFITGEETRIYYPRAEHSVVTYDGQSAIHYATTVPEGEARYLLNKDTGEVDLSKGPQMLLPDPRNEVIIKRILSQKMVNLIYPGNKEAAEYNAKLEEITVENSPDTYARGYIDNTVYSNSLKKNFIATAGSTMYGDQMQRKSTYTKPRTITLDTKYEGVPKIILWPGYAIQIIDNKGDRRVEVGPKTVMLKYDETLEILSLSTGKPKSDNKLLETVYLQTTNNIVSDIVQAETKDMVELNIKIAYRVNFEASDSKKWFVVPNYVKLLTQNCNSILRNIIKKTTIEEFNKNGVDIIRDTIIGKSTAVEGTEVQKRPGRKFEENGMRIYDVEVLDIQIGDEEIDELLKDVQKESIQNQIRITRLKQEEDLLIKEQISERERARQIDITDKELAEIEIKKATRLLDVTTKKEEVNKAKAKDDAEIESINLAVKVEKYKVEENHAQSLSDIAVSEIKGKMEAITPDIVGAVQNLANATVIDSLAKNLKESNTGLSGLLNGSGGGKSFVDTLAGIPPLAEIFGNALEKAKQKSK